MRVKSIRRVEWIKSWLEIEEAEEEGGRLIGCCPRPYSATCQYQAGGRPRQPEEQSSRCGLEKLPLHLPLPHAALTSLSCHARPGESAPLDQGQTNQPGEAAEEEEGA